MLPVAWIIVGLIPVFLASILETVEGRRVPSRDTT